MNVRSSFSAVVAVVALGAVFAGCSSCVRKTTAAEPPESVLAHPDDLGYQRMSSRYRAAHSLADFKATYAKMPHVSKAEFVMADTDEVKVNGSHAHVKGRFQGSPQLDELRWDANVVNESKDGQDQWRCDELTVDGVVFR